MVRDRCRSSDIYMGWKHGNEKAGHIPYAKFFSAQWLDTRWRESAKDYEVRLKIQMESQGIVRIRILLCMMKMLWMQR